MKRINFLFLLISLLLLIPSRLWGQKLQVDYSGIPISKVIDDLESRTEYSFVYQKHLLEGAGAVTLKTGMLEFSDILERIFPPAGLDYEIVRTTVVLKKSEMIQQATSAVSGTVYDADGGPLPGVMVIAGNNSNGTSTDLDGKFTLPGVREGEMLTFSCIGLKNLQLKARRAPMNVVMESDVTTLSDVVVIAYGTSKKSDLTGSVASVKMSDIVTPTSVSIDNALQGRIAGADFLSTDGAPGSTTSIRIRGTRSISASNEPLFVVDGVIDAIKDINDINPEDIASVSVLKDASSTAIYGSRGANGVIIVTTKQSSGTQKRPTVNFKTDIGVSYLPEKLDIMDASEFALYRNDYAYFGTDSGNTSYGPDKSLAYAPFPDPLSIGKGTDWYDQVIRTAVIQNYFLSISGRSDSSQYYATAAYNDTQGIIQGSGQKRFTGRIKVSRQLYKWLNLGYNGYYTWRKTEENKVTIAGTNSWGGAQYLSPHIDPKENYNPYYVNGIKINTPRALIDQNTYDTARHSTNHTITAVITPVEGLKINSSFSYFLYQRHVYRYYPGSLPKKTESEGGEAYRLENDQKNMSSETTVQYILNRKGHSLDILGGFSAYLSSANNFSLQGSGYMDDEVMWNNMNAVLDKETYSAATSFSKTTKMSAFARFNYNFKQRYYLTFTGRADGASNFAENNKWAFFPSGAFRWNISNENFMKGATWLDLLALRLSAGLSGNDAISAYRSLAALSTTTSGYLFDGSQPVATYTGRLAAPNLTWEKTAAYNAAIDAEFFKSRLNLTAEIYYTKTMDLLLTMQVPTHTGFSTRYGNIGTTSNRGVELTVDSRNIDKPHFGWTTTLTMSHNSQLVENVGTEEFVSALSAPSGYMMYGYVAGYPLNALWGFKYGGVWHNNEEIAENEYTRAYVSDGTRSLGKMKFYDINHDGVLSQNDLVYQGNSDPYLYGGIQNTFYLYNFKFGFYFAYSLGGKMYNYAELYMAGSAWTNQYRYMLQAWHPVRNPESDYPRAGSVATGLPSDFLIHDASYLRLKSVSLSYTFDLAKKVKWMKEVTLGISGDNLFLWKKYNGFDPDVSSEGTSSTLRRLDLGAYPKGRTFTFSIQVKL